MCSLDFPRAHACPLPGHHPTLPHPTPPEPPTVALLILGLILFLGGHAIAIVAPGQRAALLARLGRGPYMGLYSLVSAAGFVLVIYGFGAARADTVVLWNAPAFGRPLAVALNFVALILLGAYLVPAGRIKAAIGHPMMIGTALWSVGHLLANGTLADLVLFGSFLAWALADLASLYARDRAAGTVRVAGPPLNDAIAIGIGIALFAALVLFGHRYLFGVSPLG